MPYQTIVTHNDFDGMASAALCCVAFGLDRVLYTHPNAVSNATIAIGEQDIVCDLPCPLSFALWFDHHEGNLQDVLLRGGDPTSLKGKFLPEKSCAQVILGYCAEQGLALPEHLHELVVATNIIDSFDYTSVEEWRRENPAHILDRAIKADKDPRRSWQFLKFLTLQLRGHSLAEVALEQEVQNEYQAYLREEKLMLELLRECVTFHPEDREHQLVLIDLTRYQRQGPLVKNLAMIDHPEAMAMLLIKNQFQYGIKTTNLIFSMSLSIKANNLQHSKNCAAIFQELALGDGHPGAAGGRRTFSSRVELENSKWEICTAICKRFLAQ